MINKLKFVAVLFGLFFLTGCSITQVVEPVAENTKIDKIWIQHESKTHNEGLEPELANIINNAGFKTQIFNANSADNPGDFVLRYSANWRWDLAMYLEYFKAEIYKGAKVVGSLTYNARNGGGNFGKFGKTRNKIEPLIIEMLHKATPVDGNASSN